MIKIICTTRLTLVSILENLTTQFTFKLYRHPIYVITWQIKVIVIEVFEAWF